MRGPTGAGQPWQVSPGPCLMTGQPWQVSPGLRGEGLRNNCSSTHCWGTGPRGSGTSSKDLYVVDTVSSPSKMEHDPSFLCVQLACSIQSVQTSYPSPVFHGDPFDPQGQRPCCWVGWRQALCGPLAGPLPQPFLMATVHPQVAGNIEWSGSGRPGSRGYRSRPMGTSPRCGCQSPEDPPGCTASESHAHRPKDQGWQAHCNTL